MDIQIHDGITLFTNIPKDLENTWKTTIEEPLDSLRKIIPMSFAQMGAATPEEINDELIDMAKKLQEANIPQRVLKAVTHAYEVLKEHGHTTFPRTLHVAILVSNGKNPMHNDLNHGFTGFGGIPGFIILILSPTDYVIQRIEAHVAHEFHHNIRFLIEPWPMDRNISVGRFLLDEGLAEAFGAALYGEENIGDQTIGLRGDELERVKKIIEPHLFEVGFFIAQSYLYGGIFHSPEGELPHGAGYAVGYSWVKDFLAREGGDIFSLTKVASLEILHKLFPSS